MICRRLPHAVKRILEARAHNAGLVAAIALLFFAPATQLQAVEVFYPENDPQFSVVVPDGWNPVFRDDSLLLQPGKDDGFLIQINEQPAEAQKALPALSERVAGQLKLTDLEVGKRSEAENQHDVECTVVTSRGRTDKTEIVITMVAFSTDIEDERHFTLQSVGSAALNRKHGEALLSVIDSIKPVDD